MIRGVNRFAFTEPMEDQTVALKERSGFGSLDQTTKIVPLKIVFTSVFDERTRFDEGETIYVRGETYVTPWAKKVFSLGGKAFIMVPFDEILMYDSEGEE
ncbi:MAG: hypothetical protein ACTSVM_01615 [Candidatus Ranarchaeia archaeon]